MISVLVVGSAWMNPPAPPLDNCVWLDDEGNEEDAGAFDPDDEGDENEVVAVDDRFDAEDAELIAELSDVTTARRVCASFTASAFFR